MLRGLLIACGVLAVVSAHADDWPTLHHDNQRSGFTRDVVRAPYEQKWARDLDGEILTTRMEAIVAEGKVSVGTYAGRLHALSADTGEALWAYETRGPILHSPCYAEGVVYVGSAGGDVAAVDATDGTREWAFEGVAGGFAASPTVAGDTVLIGGRDGVFYGLNRTTGKERWRLQTGGPIRNTAAVAGDRVVFVSDDMHAYAVDLRRGDPAWRSGKLQGLSARSYYPVVLGDAVAIRTNPSIAMPQRIGADRHLLCENAGIDDSRWQNVDAWLKSDKTIGTPELIAKEQDAILRYVAENPDAQTFHLLDLATGEEKVKTPILWGAGCQGVGVPPVLTADGRPIVFYRSVYSNWTHGVAPIVALGYLDPATGRLDPIRHTSGAQPPWNTFWGTADETTNYSVGGDILYICHQGTLTALDLNTCGLFHIAGNRDTWGGLPNLPGVLNEWHGPARGSASISGDTLYWVTGSRIIAIKGVGGGA